MCYYNYQSLILWWLFGGLQCHAKCTPEHALDAKGRVQDNLERAEFNGNQSGVDKNWSSLVCSVTAVTYDADILAD